ncbi:MAG: hypothetical protein ABGW77_06265 [Campylobacterales bacterium]
MLAGGRSSRFGRDKTRLFYKYLRYRLRESFKNPIFVAKKRKFRGVPFYRERGRKYAPIFPIIELLQKHRKIVVIAADTPLIGGYQLGRLLRSNRVAEGNPLIGVYLRRRDLGKLRRRARGDLRLQKIAPTLPIPSKMLININYPSDLNSLPPHLLPLFSVRGGKGK